MMVTHVGVRLAILGRPRNVPHEPFQRLERFRGGCVDCCLGTVLQVRRTGQQPCSCASVRVLNKARVFPLGLISQDGDFHVLSVHRNGPPRKTSLIVARKLTGVRLGTFRDRMFVCKRCFVSTVADFI